MFNLFMSILLLANNSLARHGDRAFTLRGVLLTAPLSMFSSEMIIAKPNPSIYLLEKGPATKSDAFSEKFQTALNPPPSFSENHALKALFKQGPKSAT